MMGDKKVRQACRDREPLDGADAQALEHALTQVEEELSSARAEVEGYKEACKTNNRLFNEAKSNLTDLLDVAEEAARLLDFYAEHPIDWECEVAVYWDENESPEERARKVECLLIDVITRVGGKGCHQ